MKKLLMCLTIALSFVGVSSVSADTIDLLYSDTLKPFCYFYVTDYDYLKELGFDDELQEVYRLLIEEYNDNYSDSYPYYYLDIVVQDSQDCNVISSFNSVGTIIGFLNLYTTIPTFDIDGITNGEVVLSSLYTVSSANYDLPTVVGGYSYVDLIRYDSSDAFYNPMAYFISNFDLVNNSGNIYNVTGNSNFTINPGDIIKPMFTVDNAFQTGYIEINLNNYSYIALALKDYNQNSFSTTVQVKGQYCITPVYNYGMTERKDILTGTQVERCSPYYENYTPVRTYILDSDLKNNSIYYLKSYDTTKDNYVKIDTTVFDVTLITEEEADNPYVTVNGTKYPTISYDKLTDTATKSEDEGYISGASQEFSFSDIFASPLEFLQSTWSAIASFFSMIVAFIALLPHELQGFLFASFTLAIVLGLIKILL